MTYVTGREVVEGQFEAKGTENLVEKENKDCYILLQLTLTSKNIFLQKQEWNGDMNIKVIPLKLFWKSNIKSIVWINGHLTIIT